MTTIVEPQFPEAVIILVGDNINAGTIMAQTTDAMRGIDAPIADINAYRVEAMSGSYEDLLALTRATVTVLHGDVVVR